MPRDLEHPISNIQRRTSNVAPCDAPLGVGCWMFEVGCFCAVRFRPLQPQGSGHRGKTVARSRLMHFSPSPGGEGRGEGGHFGSPHFHEPPNPRRGVRSPEPVGNRSNHRINPEGRVPRGPDPVQGRESRDSQSSSLRGTKFVIPSPGFASRAGRPCTEA